MLDIDTWGDNIRAFVTVGMPLITTSTDRKRIACAKMKMSGATGFALMTWVQINLLKPTSRGM
jgi:hypothetical protein